jgi:hypothetical protein
MRKLLFIGVGGTGGKTLRYLYRELDRRLAALGWDGPVPECWQFIHVDAPERPDGFDDDVPLVLRNEADGYVPLGRSPHLYPVHDEELTSVDALLPALVGWRPDPMSDQEPPWLGAGQRRAIGRVLGLTSLSEVAAAIDVAVGELDNPAHQAEYLRVCALLDPEQERASAAEKVAVVVSSLGGGTGSGTFLDVVEILLSHAPDDNHWLRNPMTVLFAPDVFDNTPGTAEVSANTLGALSELLAAFEHEGPPPVAEANLLRSQGLGLPPSDRRTAKHNFLIGRESAKVVFQDE